MLTGGGVGGTLLTHQSTGPVSFARRGRVGFFGDVITKISASARARWRHYRLIFKSSVGFGGSGFARSDFQQIIPATKFRAVRSTVSRSGRYDTVKKVRQFGNSHRLERCFLPIIVVCHPHRIPKRHIPMTRYSFGGLLHAARGKHLYFSCIETYRPRIMFPGNDRICAFLFQRLES